MQAFYGHEKPLTDGGFTPDGRYAVSVGEDICIRVWDPKNGETIQKIGPNY